MLELLLGGKRASATLPIGDTGPGPNELIGSYARSADQLAGYYGSVSYTTMGFTRSWDIYTLLGINQLGQSINNPNTYYKFYLDGKILFSPVRASRSQMYWRQLYELGMVHGSDDVGIYPSGLNITPTKQNKTLTIGGYVYRVRLWRGAPNNPTKLGTASGGYTVDDPSVLYGSEWNRLVYNICSTPDIAGQEGAKWDSISPSTLGVGYGYGKFIITADLNSASNGWVFTRSGDRITNASIQSANGTSANHGWSYVLELIGRA